MTDETNTSDNPDQTPDTPANSGAPDPATRIADSVDKEYRTLDDFPADLRSKVEEFSRSRSSRAVNEALESARTKGEYLTKADLDNALKQRDEQWARKGELQQQMERTLIQDHGIAVGSEDYDKFAEASKDFKASALQSAEGIAKIVRAAGLGAAAAAADAGTAPAAPLYQPHTFDGKPVDMPAGGIPLGQLNSND